MIVNLSKGTKAPHLKWYLSIITKYFWAGRQPTDMSHALIDCAYYVADNIEDYLVNEIEFVTNSKKFDFANVDSLEIIMADATQLALKNSNVPPPIPPLGPMQIESSFVESPSFQTINSSKKEEQQPEDAVLENRLQELSQFKFIDTSFYGILKS